MTTLRDVLYTPGARGCDIDDVAISLKEKVVLAVNNMYGGRLHKPFRDHDYVWLELEKAQVLAEAKITREDVSTMLKYLEKTKVIEHLLPQTYCVASLNVLSGLGTNLFLTSRGNGFYEDPVGMTNRWQENVKAQNNCFQPLEVIFDHNKEDVILERNLKMLFEDNPVFALRVLEKGIPVVLFNNSWNKMNSHDHVALTLDAYAEKSAIIQKLNVYNDNLLFRVNNWFDVFKNL